MIGVEFGTLSAARAWTAVLVGGAALWAVARLSRRRGIRPADRAALSVLRLAAAAAALLLILDPALLVKRRRSDAPVAVVADASASMRTLDAGRSPKGISRWEAVREAVERRWPLLSRRCSPILFRLENRLSRADRLDGEARGALSDFSRLSEIRNAAPGVRAVFFFSDGRRGGGPDPRGPLAALGVPVFTVGAGNPAAVSDLGIEGVRAAPFGFKNIEAEATVRVRLRAVPPGRARLSVFSRGERLGSRWIEWTREEVLEATVPFRPGRAGPESFEAVLDPLPAEANVRNNRMGFSMDIGRDRRRILYICGRPGPNYAFLRHQLKTDPTVELVTFVILRDMDNLLGYSDRELSLIPFPTQAEILAGLPSFDAVIFESFSFQRFGMGPAGMEALKRFVLDGGGFLIMGDEAFVPSSPYRGSAMEPLMPFALDREPSAGPGRFHAEPPAGPVPFSAFEKGAEEWERLPLLEGGGAFPGALRKGAIPILRAEGDGPLAAVWGAGRGRVMGLASLSTWRWALGGREETYIHFWSQALAWLTGEAEFKRVRLLPPEAADPGEETILRALVRDEAGRPVADAEGSFTVREADGGRGSGVFHAAGGGNYLASTVVKAAGPAAIVARFRRGGSLLGEDRIVLNAGSSWNEAADVTPDFALLEDISRSTGGRFTTLAGFTDDWVKEALAPLAWETRRRIPLGKAWPAAAALIILLLAEWIYRRRRGFP